MTYSHNSVRNNIRMTTASATKSIRLKKGASSGTSASNSSTPSPTSPPVSPTSVSASAPATPLVTAHSNSIASSTNNTHFLSSSPTSLGLGLGLSSLATPPNQRQRQLQSQSQSTGSKGKQQQQRQSPQQQGGGGFFFANNNRRNGGGRSPQGAIQVRQSPATILGGGFSPGIAGGSARKQRKSPPLGGKISPQQQMQMQQQHPLIPTALTHFAGSKCFDAPAPTALPKPPQHWTLTRSEGKFPMAMPSMPKFQVPMQTGRSKRNLLDDFDTHNLKLLLNVQS
ncbi:histone acetyltransferase p300 [Drosophila eugracilis]|uniref:histone acetyltransferase p300 n=1 Tax=Drosophila eugracilis TaxID=29029 RepID=UPI0007E818BE|nr:histone acetyltransferase p300 [Drosophila eugracilis]